MTIDETMKFKKSEWLKYEHEFYNLCVEKKWFVQSDEDDGSAYLEPAREDKRELYRVYAHGPGLCGIIIQAKGDRPAGTKNSILKKMIRAKIITGEIKKNGNSVYIESADILTSGEGEAIAIFKIDRLARAVKTLNLRKVKRKTVSMEEILIKTRKLYDEESREYLQAHYGFRSERIMDRFIKHSEKYSWQMTNNYIVARLDELHKEDKIAYHDERLI